MKITKTFNMFLSAVMLFFFSMTFLAKYAFAESPGRFCILCDGPNRIYACSIKYKGTVDRARLGFQCTTDISKRYRHKSCTISKIGSGVCEGKRISLIYGKQPKERSATVAATGNSRILPSQGRNKTTGRKLAPTRAGINPNRKTVRKRKSRKRYRRRKKQGFFAREGAKIRRDFRKAGRAISRCFGSYFKRC